jgi:uroporphyrin-III C-methyltransferase
VLFRSAVVSGHVAPEDPRSEVDWAALATSRLTIVILMGVATLGSIAEALIAAGLPADTPAACIADGASPQQRTVRAALFEIASAADEGGFAPPAITVVGEVVDALGGAPG